MDAGALKKVAVYTLVGVVVTIIIVFIVSAVRQQKFSFHLPFGKSVETNPSIENPHSIIGGGAGPVGEAPTPVQALPQQGTSTSGGRTGAPPKDSAELQMKRLSIDFASRFGSFSTDSRNQNLEQLLGSMSASLRTWAIAKISQNQKIADEAFQSVRTRGLSAKVIDQNSTHANVEVQAQREYTEGAATHIAYEIATVELTRANAGAPWLVNSVSWKPKQP